MRFIRALVLVASASTLAPAAGLICANCHPKETARYLATPMGTSLVAPTPAPAGKINHAPSGSVITIELTKEGMIHSLSERGLSASYKIAYQIGGRMMGRTFLVQHGDYLVESPASWFNAYGWDVSPGYSGMAVIDFDRVMDQQCLFCHADSAQFSDPDGRRMRSGKLSAISCDRCHGNSDAHLRNPSRGNIVNPAKLSGRARDSICEQCHLEGATRILNPGMSWNDFHPSTPTEATFATYVLRGGTNQDVIAVSQVEQLAQSKCVRATQGKLWCGTCHSVHGPLTDRKAQIRAICTGCHSNLSASAHPQPVSECTSCHMPQKQTTDISHAALTDHRILRRPGTTMERDVSLEVSAWSEPPVSDRERDLALAQIVVGFSKQIPTLTQTGFRTLQSLPAESLDADPAALSDLEGFYVQQRDPTKAIQTGLRIAGLQPQSAKAALNLAIVYKQAGLQDKAEQELNRAIQLDPGLKQAYMELAQICANRGAMQQAKETIDRYLNWQPQDILFRVQRARMN